MTRTPAACLLALAACCPPATTAAPPAAPATPAPPPAPVEVTRAPVDVKVDGGTMTILVDGAAVGVEGFELRRAGDELVLQHHVEANLFGQRVRGHATVVGDAAGRPRRGEARMNVDGVDITTTLAGGPDALVVTTRTGDAPEKQERAAGPVDLYFDHTSFAHWALLCAAPASTLTAFPGTRVVLGPAREHGGVRAVPLDIAGSLAADLFCEGERFLGLDVPLMSIAVTRDGAEARVAPLRRKPREKPAVPAGLVELPRTVSVPAAPGVPAATLACSLVVPASHAAVAKRTRRGPQRALPAVTFITGSGNQDRDEDSYGSGGLKLSIFKTIAIELGQAGIASLRCDDRGGGGSTGDFKTATLQVLAADAAAALAALRAEPAVDPARTGMVGHSEGGIIAPLVSLALKPKPRALVLMAGTGRPFDVIIQEQLKRGLERSGLPAAEAAAELARRQAIYDALRAGKPLPAGLDPIEAKEYSEGQEWMISHLRHDPAATAARVKGVAVLIAQGALDQQVAVADADALEAALRPGNKVVEKIVYPGLNHLFAATTTGNLIEYTDPDARVDAGFLGDVVRFLKTNL